MEKERNKKITKKDVKKFIKDNSHLICYLTGLTIGGVFAGRYAYDFGLKKGYDRCSREAEESMRLLLRRICPNTNTKYVVERFSDFQGKTYGEYETIEGLKMVLREVLKDKVS